MKKIISFLKYTCLGLDPFILKLVDKNKSNYFLFAYLTLSALIFIVIFFSSKQILFESTSLTRVIVSIIVFVPIYYLFSFSIISWRLTASKKNTLNKVFSYSIRGYFILSVIVFTTVLAYVILHGQKYNGQIDVYRYQLTQNYQESLNLEVELLELEFERSLSSFYSEINDINLLIQKDDVRDIELIYFNNRISELDSIIQLKKDENLFIINSLIDENNESLNKFKSRIELNPLFFRKLKSSLSESNLYVYLSIAILFTVLILINFYRAYIDRGSEYHLFDLSLQKEILKSQLIPIIDHTIKIYKENFGYEYKPSYPDLLEINRDKIESKLVYKSKDELINKLKNAL